MFYDGQYISVYLTMDEIKNFRFETCGIHEAKTILKFIEDTRILTKTRRKAS